MALSKSVPGLLFVIHRATSSTILLLLTVTAAAWNGLGLNDQGRTHLRLRTGLALLLFCNLSRSPHLSEAQSLHL